MAKRRTRQFIVIRTIRLVAVSPVMTPKEAKNRLADCTGEGVWEIKCEDRLYEHNSYVFYYCCCLSHRVDLSTSTMDGVGGVCQMVVVVAVVINIYIYTCIEFGRLGCACIIFEEPCTCLQNLA